MAGKQTDAFFRSRKPAEKPYKAPDANGLYMLVQPNGSRLWRYRYRIDGKENVFAIDLPPLSRTK